MKSQNTTGITHADETWSSDRVKKLTLEKVYNSPSRTVRHMPRNFIKRFAIVAIIVIFAMAATIFTMSYYYSSFDKLTDIIGDDLAESLQPLEISGVVRKNTIDAGFKIELVAVGVSSNIIDLYLTIEDLQSNRFDGDFQLIAWVNQKNEPVPTSVTQFSNIINRTDDGVVTLHAREVFYEPITGQELELKLDSLSFNYRYGELDVDFDMSTLEEHAPAAFLWGTPILPPHMHDISIALDGFECAGFINISSIGLIDGKLHIQEEYDMTALYRWVDNKVKLIDPYGNIIKPSRNTYDGTSSVSFRIGEQVNFYNDRGIDYVVDFPYRENIFVVDPDRISEYRLAASFEANDHIDFTWSAKFEVTLDGSYMDSLVADGLDIWTGENSTTITEVQLTPYSLIISGLQGYHIDDSAVSDDAMLGFTNLQLGINMADGTVIGVKPGWSRFETDTRIFSQLRYIDANFIDLDSVVSVTLNGEKIKFR